MSITRIMPEVRSNNVEVTHDFYTNTLGLIVDIEEGNFLMMSSPANTSAELMVNDNGFTGLPPSFAVDVGTVEQLQQMYQAVTAQGRPMVEPLADKPWGIRRFSILDPHGVRITVVSHIEIEEPFGTS
ncbi:MAG: hypothetical protein GFH27_549301n180 [Chloroflexi bacterium AL-W]|nr:hypothetical protein [Chloroflexi bacterium AL-N1]NOK68373.1 hypothetical protein [Chloroflexi bacterium AL-N10]NOK74019.1 hypothetical protein [Chloroflexi bacterium AL-N5]NOK82987.1 hypothetical protein [Chloroflexi bacterium AL-W]NOK90509.1 hypothetical protein [Chloroflexi bacterium AL-N15]